MPKRPWRPRSHDYDDDELRRAKREAMEAIRSLLDRGNDEDVKDLARTFRPDITEKELDEIVTLFREARGEHGRS